MDDQLNLFIDEYPPDLCRGPIFCIAVIETPDGFYKAADSLDFGGVLSNRNTHAYLGYIDSKKEGDILSYLKKESLLQKDGINGANMLWSTMAIYCVAGFLMSFYKFDRPSINLFHDRKNMADEHRLAMHDFLKQQIPKYFDAFSEGRAKPYIGNIQESEKGSLGIETADFITKEFIKNGSKNLGNFSSMIMQDLSHYVAENPKKLYF